MANGQNPGDPTAGSGVVESLLALFGGLVRYLQARGELLGLETREASLRLLVFCICLMVSFVLFLSAYIFVVVLLFLLVQRVSGLDAIWTSLIFAVVHAIGGIAAAFAARKRLQFRFFPHTLDQLEIDRAWLKHLPQEKAPKR